MIQCDDEVRDIARPGAEGSYVWKTREGLKIRQAGTVWNRCQRIAEAARNCAEEVRRRGKIMALDKSMTDRQPETQGKETYSTSC
jgi:hypothetical protein